MNNNLSREMDQNKKIKLVLINQKAMTFNADDYMTIRNCHRIVGKLIGVSPPYPRNVNLLHLPACFSDYETKLMIDENIVTLIHQNDLADPPCDEMKNAFESHQKKILEELQDFHMRNKLDMTVQNMEKIINGKRNKLIRSGVPESEINLDPQVILEEEKQKYQQTYIPQNLHTQIPTEYPFKTCKSVVIESYQVGNMAKYKVFHDLWKKGLYITNADNFGGDFLTYNGDPIDFHATQIVHIVTQNDLMEPHFLISCVRLSVSVKKKCIFAYLDSNGSVVFQTVDWDNPKTREIQDASQDSNKSSLSAEFVTKNDE